MRSRVRGAIIASVWLWKQLATGALRPKRRTRTRTRVRANGPLEGATCGSETRRRDGDGAARADERGGRLLLLLRRLLDGARVLIEHVVRLVALGLEHLRRVQHVQQLRVVHLEQHASDLAGQACKYIIK